MFDCLSLRSQDTDYIGQAHYKPAELGVELRLEELIPHQELEVLRLH